MMPSGISNAESDRAIVVGIRDYPHLDPLSSPENDARAFYEWVTTPAEQGGGGIDSASGRARLILSTDFHPPFPLGMEPPTIAQIEPELIALDDLAEQNRSQGQGLQVGRRLYLYFSGHGCAPRFEEAAVLMANATRRRVYHLTGMPIADWFFRAGYFEEIVLLMDCCRERYEKVATYVPPWIDLTLPDVMDRSQRFYGMAAEWSQRARERVMADGQSRGVFTMALLAGLRGAAFDPETRFTDPATNRAMARVTAASLKRFLYNFMKDFLSDADRDDPQVAKLPDIPHPRDPNADMTFSTVQVPVYPVTLRLPREAMGRMLRITILHEDREEVIVERPVDAPEIVVPLSRDNYLAQLFGFGFAKSFSVRPVAEGVANVITL
jgi:hypothetical protein